MSEFLNTVITLYENWNKPKNAKEWRAILQETESVIE
jgi:hypothetical protein